MIKKMIKLAILLSLAVLCLLVCGTAHADGAETLRFPNGTETAADAAELDLSTLTHKDLDEAIALLEQMPKLSYVDLGADCAVTRLEQDGTPLPTPTRVWTSDYLAQQDILAPETDEERLSWKDIRRLMDAVPNAKVEYRFHIGDLQFSTRSAKMDINHIRFDDEGALIREILPCMQRLRTLDMDFCGVSSERMAEIRDAYPSVNVIWRVWFGENCSVRTDVTRLLVSAIYGITDANTSELRYCTKVKYLDLGHDGISDIRFVSEMRDLEVLIISLTNWYDLTPITGLEKLEFFEACCSGHGGVYDLSPIGTCPNLKHVNICVLGEVTGYESFVNLSKLERLWIGYATDVPQEWVDEIQKAVPQAEINTTEPTGCNGTWRYGSNGELVPRYAELRRQFDYDNFNTVVAFLYNDPLYALPKR